MSYHDLDLAAKQLADYNAYQIIRAKSEDPYSPRYILMTYLIVFLWLFICMLVLKGEFIHVDTTTLIFQNVTITIVGSATSDMIIMWRNRRWLW